MFKDKKILAVIPARGGSKGVPGKNIKLVGGKPLIAWMIEAAKKSIHIDRLILSSDDNEIIRVAGNYGCEAPFVRPSDLARDDSSISDVILHVLDKILGYDYVALLQPTSPLTLTEDIDGCIEFCISNNSKSTVSVTRPGKSPYWMFKMAEDNKLSALLGEQYLNRSRQDLPVAYLPTGAVYVSEINCFLENRSFYSDSTTGFEIPRERSIDIDSILDFKIMEAVISENHR